MKSILVLALLVTGTSAMATDLYHCTVNSVTDGYFTFTDFKVEGNAITAAATIKGQQSASVSAFFENGDNGKKYTTIIYQEGRELTESLSFVLSEVTGKLGPGLRETIHEGFGATDKPVEMICQMAMPI